MTSENGNVLATMPMAPVGYGNGGGFGNGWGNDIWLIIIILFALGGFGGWGFGGGFGMGGYDNIGGALYPWMNQADITTSGFQNAATNQAISSLQNSVTSGFGDVQTALCAGFAGVNAGLANGFAQAEIGENARQMANMNQIFGLSQQLAQSACDNKSAIKDVQYTVATEACADRNAVASALRDVLEANNASTQKILDQMCADKIDAKNEKIVELQNQLNMAALRESQTAQNALIQQGFSNEIDQMYNRLSTCPVPSVPVYGRQAIFSCGGNSTGCGCGCGMS